MRWVTTLLLAGLLAACGDRADFWDELPRVDGPLVAADRIAFVNRTAATLALVEPGSDEPVTGVPVQRGVRAVAAWSQGLLLSTGPVQAPVLEIRRLADEGRRVLELDEAWDRVEVDPDADLAVLLYDGQPASAGGTAVRNPNRVALVDLAAGTVRALTLQTESLAARQVVFGPDQVAILFDNAVALVDRAAPTRHLTVPLKLRDGTSLRPQQATFSPGGGFLFVRTTGTDDVVALEVLDAGERLDVAINFLFAQQMAGLRDVAVAEEFGEAVLALYGNGAALLDAAGDVTATRSVSLELSLGRLVPLGDGLVFVHAEPGTGDSSRGVAAWAPLEGRVTTDRLELPLRIAPVVAGGTIFLPQNQAVTAARLQRDPARLRLDLQVLQLGGFPVSAIADEERAWIGLAFQEDEGGSLVAIDAGSLTGGGLSLDARPVALGLVGDSVFAVHPEEVHLGDLTLVPRDDVRADAATRYAGIAAAGLLDREAP